MPNALTKHAIARPPVSARLAIPRVKARFRPAASRRVFWKSAWNVSHSLTKPLSGGSAAIAAEPTRKQAAVHGIRLTSPPIASMLRVPVAWTTAPAPRKSSALNAAWFDACDRAPRPARAPRARRDRRPGRARRRRHPAG